MVSSISELVEKCSSILKGEWDKVFSSEGFLETEYKLSKDITDTINRSINSKTKSYRYVLPTQVVAKLANPMLDARCLQTGRGGVGAFDARSVAHKVIVPFDKDNENVLGGSPEPYVNNPLRCPELSLKYRNQQKDKVGWDDLCLIVETIEEEGNEKYTQAIFRQVLQEIYKRLIQTEVTYSVPKRISADQLLAMIDEFIKVGSGGDRVLSVSTALLETVGEVFNIFSKVRRFNINAADSTSGLVADIECCDSDGEIVIAVEVKDKQLSFTQIQDKLPMIRSRSVSEILFLAQKGVVAENGSKIEDLIKKEFASGQNIYILRLTELLPTIFVFLGEVGRRKFMINVGEVLDKYGSRLRDRREWADLLKSY
ncbi:restriction endonuclease, SacI family [candidate division WOR-3 bacterium]|nr:restriction endonuclease, SacI family [candidate division WOR-3 bacterium]